MYTILVKENNELVTTIRERIMQRSKLVDNLHFLVDPMYKTHNMSGFTVTMEYIMPVSREYKTETLMLSEALYKDKLEYKLPFDTNLTKEAGKIKVQLTFTKVEMDADGQANQYVRKTSPTYITIVPISSWSDIIPDSALSGLDQRLIQMDIMIGALNDMNQELYETKADNIVYNKEDSSLQLTANGEFIGDKVEIIGGNVGGVSVTDCKVNENGHLIVTLSDNRIIDAGCVEGADGITFIPSIDEEHILSWSNNGGLENPDPIDLNRDDEWETLPSEGIESDDYTWSFM